MKICVHCGSQVRDKHGLPADESYDCHLHKKTGIMKLLECGQCSKVVDKYIEYEGCLILLDLALQTPAAYRHVLVNAAADNTKLVLKLVFITLIIDGFCKWSEGVVKGEGHDGGEESLFLEQEYQFYAQIGVSFICLCAYLLTSMFIFLGNQQIRNLRSIYVETNWRHVFLGLLLTYCARCLKVMALLWEADRSGFLWIFVDILFFLTTITIYKTFAKMNTCQSTMTAVCAHAALHFLELVNRKILQ
jgi:hypothetical protein